MTSSGKGKGFINSIGDLHEESALELMGGDAQNLNHHPKLEGMALRGGNFDTYDIFSSEEICSVKARMVENTSEPNLGSYKSEFRKMMGYNRAHKNGLSPLEQDEQRLIECGERGLPIPEELKGATREEVVNYLQTKSTMRVPSDHVEEVRTSIIAYARQLPENYHLYQNPTEEQLQALGNRIQSTGLDSEESLKQIDARKDIQEQHRNQGPIPQEVMNTASKEMKPINRPNQEPSKEEDYDYGYGY